jgi:muconolactone delta-isomerase
MRFMVTLTQKTTSKPEEIQALVPAEQAQVAKLIKEGALETTYVWQKGAWVVIKADSAEQAGDILKTLPLYPHLDHAITPIFG